MSFLFLTKCEVLALYDRYVRCRLVPAVPRPRASRGCSLPASDRLLSDGRRAARCIWESLSQSTAFVDETSELPWPADGLFSSHQRQVHRGASSTSIIAFLDERYATGTYEFDTLLAWLRTNTKCSHSWEKMPMHYVVISEDKPDALPAPSTRPAHLDYLKTQDLILLSWPAPSSTTPYCMIGSLFIVDCRRRGRRQGLLRRRPLHPRLASSFRHQVRKWLWAVNQGGCNRGDGGDAPTGC